MRNHFCSMDCGFCAPVDATAVIYRYRCDPDAHWNMDVYKAGNRTSFTWRSMSSLELGEVLEWLPQLKRTLDVSRLVVNNERLLRTCREIECDRCHSR